MVYRNLVNVLGSICVGSSLMGCERDVSFYDLGTRNIEDRVHDIRVMRVSGRNTIMISDNNSMYLFKDYNGDLVIDRSIPYTDFNEFFGSDVNYGDVVLDVNGFLGEYFGDK